MDVCRMGSRFRFWIWSMLRFTLKGIRSQPTGLPVGDVFPVGPVKMRPFPPVAPNGRRSFPSKETTKGINHWNHYYVRAVDGEVKALGEWEEVSGGDNISASGYLCLESEGAPIEFRNIRLRRLSADQGKVHSHICSTEANRQQRSSRSWSLENTSMDTLVRLRKTAS